MTRRQLAAVGLAALIGLSGCSGEPPTATVVGLVTLDGKPVDGGTVALLPSGGGTPVMAPIGPDGRYRADGVPAGEVLVGVTSPVQEVDQAIMKNVGGKGPPPAPKVKVQYPGKYADPAGSGLKVSVTSGDAAVTFDIPMKK